MAGTILMVERKLRRSAVRAICAALLLPAAVLIASCAGADKPMAQRSSERVFFDNPDMDYYMLWILGREVFDGVDRQECLSTASRIVDGNTKSWESEWARLAVATEADAETLRSNGHTDDARNAFLRACTYYRAPLFIMDPDESGFRGYVGKMQECFAKASTLFSPPLERVEVAYKDRMMAGYFWKPDPEVKKRPTLILIGGMETWVEDNYFFTGMLATARGYNVLTVDLPGQGVNPDQGLFLESQADLAVKRLLDFASRHPEVDSDRMALMGISWGSYIVLKGAVDEPRLKAVIADPATPDIWSFGMSQQSGDRGDPIKTAVFKQLSWRYGVKISDFFGRINAAFDWSKNGKADPARISCPVLCIAGAGEAAEAQRQARACYELLPDSRKKLVVFTKEDGSELHCQVDNLGLLNKVALDWLDTVMRDR